MAVSGVGKAVKPVLAADCIQRAPRERAEAGACEWSVYTEHSARLPSQFLQRQRVVKLQDVSDRYSRNDEAASRSCLSPLSGC